MLGVDDVLIGGRCCIGLIRLIGLIGQISFITANEFDVTIYLLVEINGLDRRNFVISIYMLV